MAASESSEKPLILFTSGPGEKPRSFTFDPTYILLGSDVKTTVTRSGSTRFYLDEYYPGRVSDSDFKLQEESRCLYSELFGMKPNDGKDALNIIRSFRNLMEDHLSVSFKRHLDSELKQSNGKNNVRPHVRSIWLWPLNSVKDLKWMSGDKMSEALVIQGAKEALSRHTVTLHAVQSDTIKLMIDGFTDSLWKLPKITETLQQFVSGVELVKNTAPSHITLVNSGILNEVNSKEFEEVFTKDWKCSASDLEPTGVMHTVSLDYAPFSVCVVVQFKSAKLDDLISVVKKRFPKEALNLNPSYHITVAIRPRVLA